MCFFEPAGSVEVEERRPRTPYGPRRKRLYFVKDRARASDEWVLTRPPGRSPQPNEQEKYDRRWRREWEEGFIRCSLPVPVPDPRIQPLPPVAPKGPNHEQPRLEDQAHHDGEDEIIAVVEGGSHDGHGELEPRIVDVAPKAPMPPHLKAHHNGNRGRKGRRRPASLSSYESSDSDLFVQGFLAGRRESLSRRPPRLRRSRSRSSDRSDDSFEGQWLRRPPRR